MTKSFDVVARKAKRLGLDLDKGKVGSEIAYGLWTPEGYSVEAGLFDLDEIDQYLQSEINMGTTRISVQRDEE